MNPTSDPATSPTTSTLRRLSNPRAANDELTRDRVVLSNSLRLYIRHAWQVVTQPGRRGKILPMTA
jgi:hypothetical protein